MAKIVKNNLGYLGVDFQYKLIASFIERPKFFKDLYPIIDQNMFTESYLKTIVGVMKDYYKKYDITASYDLTYAVVKAGTTGASVDLDTSKVSPKMQCIIHRLSARVV